MIAAVVAKKSKLLDAIENERAAASDLASVLNGIPVEQCSNKIVEEAKGILCRIVSHQIDMARSTERLSAACNKVISSSLQSDKRGVATDVDEKSPSKPIGVLKPAVLSLLKLPQIMELLAEHEESNDNTCIILDRLVLYKVTKQKVDDIKAGVTLAKLAKHANKQVKLRAAAVIDAWKKQFKKEKANQPKSVASVMKPSANHPPKNLKPLSKVAIASKVSKAPILKSSPKTRKRNLDDEESEGDDWMEAYRKRCAAGYDMVQGEEEYSTYVGQKEDEEAEEDESREKLRLKKLGKR